LLVEIKKGDKQRKEKKEKEEKGDSQIDSHEINKSFCGCFTDRGGFFKKSPWPPEAKKVIS